MNGVGGFSALLNASAIFCKELCVESSVSKLNIVVKGGDVRIVIMSIASCYRKSSKFTLGIRMFLGKI